MNKAAGNLEPLMAETTCPRCGVPLAGGSVDGLCASCLGALNFDTLTRIGGAADDEAHVIPTVEELAEFFPQLDVLSLIGRGGMGVVYKARQKSLHRHVALKLLAPERAGDPMFARRFASEARSPDGGDAPASQAEVVKKLEARDRQLRAAIARMPKGGN